MAYTLTAYYNGSVPNAQAAWPAILSDIDLYNAISMKRQILITESMWSSSTAGGGHGRGISTGVSLHDEEVYWTAFLSVGSPSAAFNELADLSSSHTELCCLQSSSDRLVRARLQYETFVRNDLSLISSTLGDKQEGGFGILDAAGKPKFSFDPKSHKC